MTAAGTAENGTDASQRNKQIRLNRLFLNHQKNQVSQNNVQKNRVLGLRSLDSALSFIKQSQETIMLNPNRDNSLERIR